MRIWDPGKDKIRIQDGKNTFTTLLDSDPGSHDDVPLSCSAAVWEAAGGIHHRQRLVFTGTVPVSFKVIRIQM